MSMIVCEIGNIPPHSVPVVIREIMHENENDEDEDKIEEESSSDLDYGEDNDDFNEMKEQDNE